MLLHGLDYLHNECHVINTDTVLLIRGRFFMKSVLIVRTSIHRPFGMALTKSTSAPLYFQSTFITVDSNLEENFLRVTAEVFAGKHMATKFAIRLKIDP